MISFQRYVSLDLTHFVGRSLKTQESKYRLLKRILKNRILKAKPKPLGQPAYPYVLLKDTDLRLSSNEAYKGSVVCFCDIPLADLPLHIAKYSEFGLAFPKDFLADEGALPVTYIPICGRPALLPFTDFPRGRVSSQAIAFDQFWQRLNRLEKSVALLPKERRLRRAADDLEKVLEFLDVNVLSHMKFFDHRLRDLDKENFYMEREWRVSRDVRFTLNDVQRVIIPAGFARRLRRDFPEYDGEVVFGGI